MVHQPERVDVGPSLSLTEVTVTVEGDEDVASRTASERVDGVAPRTTRSTGHWAGVGTVITNNEKLKAQCIDATHIDRLNLGGVARPIFLTLGFALIARYFDRPVRRSPLGVGDDGHHAHDPAP
mgnify:CR=1 FL=1